MTKYSIAQHLIGKTVVTNKGNDLGKLEDLVVDEKSGELQSLLVIPTRQTKLTEGLTGSSNRISVPYKSVFAISQMIIVDENLLV